MWAKMKARGKDRADEQLTAIAQTTAAQLYHFIWHGALSDKLDFAQVSRTDTAGQKRVQLDFAWSSTGSTPGGLAQKADGRAHRFADLVGSGKSFSGWTLISCNEAVVVVGFE